MPPIMLIQHGEKMTKLCAVGLRPCPESPGKLLPGRCDLAAAGRLQLPQPLADRQLCLLVAF